ncbi:MAG TPA: RNA pseudouridine synthase [Bacillota bacterium]|nr:RNA pseudouridine synthase [Bacillota bacterium]
MDISILYEDNHVLVVEKPVNIPVQEDRSQDKDVLTILKEDIKVRFKKPGNVYLGLVHRLDRPVGGVMVFAKTSKAGSRLSDVIRRNALNRTYLAVTEGRPLQKKGTLTDYLSKDTKRNIVRVVPTSHKGGKKAVLDYEVLAEKSGFSIIKVRLHTGRPHQIRVQLAHAGMPIYGDQKYAKGTPGGQQISLWAHELSFPHPTKKDINTYTSYPPNEFPWNMWELK